MCRRRRTVGLQPCKGRVEREKGCEHRVKRLGAPICTPHTLAPVLRHSRLLPSGPLPCTEIRSGLRHLAREPLPVPQQLTAHHRHHLLRERALGVTVSGERRGTPRKGTEYENETIREPDWPCSAPQPHAKDACWRVDHSSSSSLAPGVVGPIGRGGGGGVRFPELFAGSHSLRVTAPPPPPPEPPEPPTSRELRERSQRNQRPAQPRRSGCCRPRWQRRRRYTRSSASSGMPRPPRSRRRITNRRADATQTISRETRARPRSSRGSRLRTRSWRTRRKGRYTTGPARLVRRVLRAHACRRLLSPPSDSRWAGLCATRV